MVAAEIAFRFGSRHTVPSLLQIRGGGKALLRREKIYEALVLH